jgi:hypothetical protein
MRTIGTFTCAHCGVAFQREAAQVKSTRQRGLRGPFCSHACDVRSRPAREVPSLEDRFWAKVDKSGECWVWTGSRNWAGYGYLGAVRGHGRQLAAHRVSWELANGSIPEGLHVLHHCDNPPCVRPEHLFVGTRSDNLSDAGRKGRLSDRPQNRRGSARRLDAALRGAG